MTKLNVFVCIFFTCGGDIDSGINLSINVIELLNWRSIDIMRAMFSICLMIF